MPGTDSPRRARLAGEDRRGPPAGRCPAPTGRGRDPAPCGLRSRARGPPAPRARARVKRTGVPSRLMRPRVNAVHAEDRPRRARCGPTPAAPRGRRSRRPAAAATTPSTKSLPHPSSTSLGSPTVVPSIGTGEIRLDRAAHHAAHELARREVRRLVGRDERAVLEDRDAVAEVEDLLEPVRHVDDGDTAGGELADDRVEQLDLVVAQRGGRLVHRDDAGVERQRLDDLDDLLLGDGERPDASGGLDERHAEIVEQQRASGRSSCACR